MRCSRNRAGGRGKRQEMIRFEDFFLFWLSKYAAAFNVKYHHSPGQIKIFVLYFGPYKIGIESK